MRAAIASRLWHASRPVENLVRDWSPRVLHLCGVEMWRRALRVERWISRGRVMLWKAAVR